MKLFADSRCHFIRPICTPYPFTETTICHKDTKQISRHPCACESDPELAFRMSESHHIALHAAFAFDICSLGHHIVQVCIIGYVNNFPLIEATLVLCMYFGIIIFDD